MKESLIFGDSSKTEKMHKVAQSIFGILINFNITDVNFSRVSRLAQVSRPWLYKYIGSSQEDLITFAIQYIGKYVTTQDLKETYKNKHDFHNSIIEGVERMFKNTELYPFFVPVYFKYKGTNTPPGQIIHEIESAYIKRQSTLFRKFHSLNENEAWVAAEILTTFRMSLAFSWQLGGIKNKTTQKKLLESLEQLLKKI